VPGLLVALLAAVSAGGVAGAALQGTAHQATAVGATGVVVTGGAGLIARLRRHRGSHRFIAEQITTAGSTQLAPTPAAAEESLADELLPAKHAFPLQAPHPALYAVPSLASRPDAMVDTVEHPVVKLFPMAHLEPELAAGTIDERVYAALDAEREASVTAALARGRHASTAPAADANHRDTSYRSRHSA
jgi:hypothetical protein